MLVLDFYFFIRKLYKHIETETAKKKKNKSRTNWVWNNETDLFKLWQQIETDKVYYWKTHEILFKKK